MARQIVNFFAANTKRASPMIELLGIGSEEASTDEAGIGYRGHGRGAKREEFTIALAGNLGMGFSKTASCVGHYDGSMRHPCPSGALGKSQCNDCRQKDIRNIYTFGNFSKFPEKYASAQKEEYSIYLAQFGEDLLKCGLTKRERLTDRLVEQGADFGAEIARFLGPDEAYEAESAIATHFGIQKTITQKAKALRLTFDHSQAQKHFDAALFKIRNSKMPLSASFEPLSLGGYYPKISALPIDADFISGSIAGSKGALVFFLQKNALYSIDMKQQVGRTIVELQSGSRQVQSRLSL